MKLKPQCIICLLQWVYGRGAAAGWKGNHFRLISRLLDEASANVNGLENTALISNNMIEQMSSIIGDTAAAYYRNLKKDCNENAAEMLPLAKSYINRRPFTRELRLERTCQIAAVANVAPLGTPSGGLVFSEVKEVLTEKLIPCMQSNVLELLNNAKNILYISDNAGEIGFDSLLISELKEMGCHVTLLVKEDVFFEDACLEDVCFFKLDKLVDTVMSTKGFFVPNGHSSPSAVDAFKNADLIIAKGTGNYEALKDETNDKPIIYMLKVKCAPIAISTGVDIGQFIITADN